jgi:tetratricopeptide (TPR) repeat protein
LIEDSQYPLALEKIEAELNSSRLKSSWLIRRAKVRIATKEADLAKGDLQAAIKELNARMNSTAPDPSLLADRGLAYELLGDKENARKDYNAAKEKGFADEWFLERTRDVRGAGSGERPAGGRRRR